MEYFNAIVGTKKGAFIQQALTVLIIVVFTSALIFFLLSKGIVSVGSSSSSAGASAEFLNTNFLPVSEETELAVGNFRFCPRAAVQNGHCSVDQRRFSFGQEVHFSFDVVSSVHSGQLRLEENYRLLGPFSQILLDLDTQNTFVHQEQSSHQRELVTIHDYFILGEQGDRGEYLLELIVSNPLNSRQVAAHERFIVE